MGIISEQLWDRYISESLARSDDRNDAIEAQLCKFAIESLLADLNAEMVACERRLLEIRDSVAQLREELGKARDTRGCSRPELKLSLNLYRKIDQAHSPEATCVNAT
jgi:predicted  nucleic acid-binding Zn-ribbon protein